MLFRFAEAGFDEGFELGEGGFFVGARDGEGEFGAFGGAEHHDAHNAFAVHGFVVAGDLRFSGVAAGEMDEFNGGASVEAEFIANGHFLFKHQSFS